MSEPYVCEQSYVAQHRLLRIYVAQGFTIFANRMRRIIARDHHDCRECTERN